jgi:hypothetical protein
MILLLSLELDDQIEGRRIMETVQLKGTRSSLTCYKGFLQTLDA